MAEWKNVRIGDLCDTISNTYKRSDDMVVLINTSDVLEGQVLILITILTQDKIIVKMVITPEALLTN